MTVIIISIGGSKGEEHQEGIDIKDRSPMKIDIMTITSTMTSSIIDHIICAISQFYRQDEDGAPCHGCADRAINIWSWNACGLSWDDLLLCTEALGRGYEWDILCLQEGQKNCSAEIIRQDGYLLVRGEGTARGAPTICLNKRLSQFFGEARFGKDFVALRLDVLPPVLVWTFHGPTAQFSDDEYVDALGDIVKAFHDMTGKNIQRYVCIGGVDCNCQLGTCRGVTGRFCKGERPGEAERAREIYGFLAERVLRVANTFLDVGFTRFPPSDLLGHAPSQIDGIVISQKLAYRFIGKGPLPFQPPSDHVPLGCQIFARRPQRGLRATLVPLP